MPQQHSKSYYVARARYLAAGLGLCAVVLFAAGLAAVTMQGRRSGAAWSLGGALPRTSAWAAPRTSNQALFESGNIGAIQRTSRKDFVLSLRSDNDDALPKFWRQWFYLRLDQVPVGVPTSITIKGAGHWSYYLPVYSYDGQRWHSFSEREVDKPTRLTTRLRKTFTSSKVFLARYQPYTYTKLMHYLDGLRARAGVTVSELGRSPQGRSVPLLRLGSDKTSVPHVVIHARTHPGEVGSSFLLEGLVDAVTESSPFGQALRRSLAFVIVPMLNVDGVVAGNNRVSPASVNLEGKWVPRADNPLELDPVRAPSEVRLMHGKIVQLLKTGARVSMALNLHSSSGEPADQAFFFPHFGPTQLGYQPAEARLFGAQTRFIKELMRARGPAWFNKPASNGTRAFLARHIPETWWWRNFQDRVMALSIESTYGRAGPHRRWTTPDDMRAMGRAMAVAIARYHGVRAEAGSRLLSMESRP